MTIISPAKRLGNVQEYYFSRKLKEIAAIRAAGVEVLNLGIGSPDLPPSKEVIQALKEQSQFPDNHAYQSYQGIPELRHAFAAWYQKYFQVSLNPALEILPLIGSKEGLMHIAMAFLNQGDEVLIPNPGYPAYRSVSNLAGATVREYRLSEENDWLPDLQALEQEGLSKVKIMWLNYPHMPTGSRATKEALRNVVAFAKKHSILVVNDNPYSFVLNEEYLSILSIKGAKEVAIELNSLSKSHNMAGWRVGMIAGAEAYLKIILRFKSNMDSGMFKPLQLAAAKALQVSKNWYDELNEVYQGRREKVFELMDILDCKYSKKGVGMFVWAKVPAHYKSGFEVSDEVLREAKIFITPGGIFGSQGDQYIRTSLCNSTEVFEKAIEKITTKRLVLNV